ncbi:EAL domain-containing protein [Motilimonas cestriensis]|uniref:EAL domain-containing protein n=1 Tax=Motilimonas cestriensis TaxID=2742685 RepID=A0ABS8WGN5_9GAMM|nr:EAL domain-containing protein [Motilimonas cestriensis]MCE2596786.1 EAL domain-containing protein [Motilimonas cestriensis]
MKLKSRLIYSYILVALLASATGLISYFYILTVKSNAQTLLNVQLVDQEKVHSIRFLLQRAKSNIREAQLQRHKDNFQAEKYATGEVRYALSQLHFVHQAWLQDVKRGMMEAGASDEDINTDLIALAQLGEPIWLFINNSFALLSLLESADPYQMDAVQEFNMVYASWLEQSRELQQILEKRAMLTKQQVDASGDRLYNNLNSAQTIYLTSLIGFLTAALLVAYFVIRSIIKPLSRLSDYAQQLAIFDFNKGPDFSRDDEFSRLGSSLETLADELLQQKSLMVTEIEQRKISELDVRHLYEFNQTLLNSVADGIFGIGPDGYISFINPSAQLLLGDKSDQLLGNPYNEFLSFIDMDGQASHLKANSRIDDVLYQKSVASKRSIAKLDTLSGRVIYVEYQATALQQDKRSAGVVVVLRDYSLKFDYEQELRLTAQVFDTLSEAIIVTDSKNRCIKVNPAFTMITGLTEADVLQQEPNFIFTEHHTQLFYKTLWHNLYAEGEWQGEIWSKRENGEMFPAWVKISVIKHNAAMTHHVITFFDISEQKEAQKQVKYLSMRDLLTGIPNRTLFQSRLKNRILSAEKSHQHVALIILDLNNFKDINNQYGLVAGDSLLKDIAAALGQVLSPQDTLARLGGDEFALVVPNIDQVNILEDKVARVLDVFKQRFMLAEEAISLSASLGVAIFPRDGDTLESLNSAAQFALQQAKALGEKVSYFHQDMNLAIEHKKQLTKALNLAVADNQLKLFYQPKVLPDTGDIVGFEALIRWQHEEFGYISPAEFIPLAEETGLIEPLGEWIILEAARQAGEWVKLGYTELKVAVNLSPKQFISARLAQVISESIENSGIQPSNLELEITESMLMENVESAILVMEQFSRQGINISLDDFGTGYSSLSYLKRFPIHTLKIDRSFVAQLASDNDDAKIVATIITMAHTLGLKVVAEGVETKEQMLFLQGRRCDQLQGYYFSRPVSALEATELLNRSFSNLI